jgi:uroporphyrinogen-III decarboxylase
MSNRDLFNRIMSYDSFDRMPVVHWDEWKETRARWIQESLPQDIDEHLFLDAPFVWETLIRSDSWLSVGSPADVIDIGLFSSFEDEVLEESDEFKVLRNKDGTVTKELKHRTSMPQYLDHAFKTAADWDQYKRKLQPNPARISDRVEEALGELSRSGQPICFPVCSLMGWARNWMGLENLCYLMHDNRDTFCDIVGTIADLTCWMMDQILPRLRVDLAHVWEDMCGVNGPFISPDMFKDCVSPGYLKIRAKLESYGVHLLEMDTDGDISRFARDLLDCGVNVLFPVEVGKFKGDAAALRKKYGKELRLVGNFDMVALERGQQAISSEIERLHALMEQGGYIIMPDHHITPGVSLQTYRWYLDQIRALRFSA